MLDKRSTETLLHILNHNDFITVRELSNLMPVSERAIRYDLKRIDDFLSEIGVNTLYKKTNRGVMFIGEKDEKDKILLSISCLNDINYSFTQEERFYIIIDSFANEKNYLTTDMLAHKLCTSNSTIKKDIKLVKEYFKQKKVNITFKQRYGLKLEGKEEDIRRCISEMYSDIIRYILNSSKSSNGSVNEVSYKLIQNRIIDVEEVCYIQDMIKNVEQELKMKFSDISYVKIISHIYSSIKRIKNDFRIIEYSVSKLESMFNTKEFDVTSHMCRTLNGKFQVEFENYDIAYIAEYILGGSHSKENNDDNINKLIYQQLLARNLIDKVDKSISLNLTKDKQLYKSLLIHLEPMVYRIKYDIEIDNPILSNVKSNYMSLYEIVKSSSEIIEEGLGKKISDSEIGYLTIHFAAAIERIKNEDIKPVKVILVCHTGYGTSELLSIQLTSIYHVKIIDVVSHKDLKDSLNRNQAEIILSTIHIEDQFDNKILCVHPILTDSDKEKLDKHFLRAKESKIEIKNLIEIIKRSCTINDYKKLESDVEQLIKVGFINSNKREVGQMLKDIVFKETIGLNVEAKDWEEAVRKGGKLLEAENIINNNYIQAMVDTVKNIGPYIVMEKGIAMPHARPEMGAKKIGASLITLKNPVNFGNEENDPVSLVICFASINSSSHLRALSDLMVLFEDEEAVQSILNAKEKEDVLEVIERISLGK
ncbi:BglG family transcription antiterminator [Clostridium sediminicola]|uniref:BglG family transcription antiterminator n=1 Tax=Clostridium sediminicola TaxID=3114879 RepID=UPI0031F206A4